MTTWLLSIILLLSLVGLGYRQGAIRVGISFLGIIFGGLAALLLGHLLAPLWRILGVKSLFMPSILGQITVFAIVMFIVKSVALVVHRRTYVQFKHREGELRFLLWERLNRRLGLYLGLANGALYMMLAAYAIYTPSYWTYQLGSSVETSHGLKILNRLGEDLQKTGMNEVAGAVKSMPESYYDAADVVGLIYNSPDLQTRLARYPSFIGLGEKPEIADLMNDPEFIALRTGNAPLSQLMNNPKVQTIMHNRDLMKGITSTLKPDLKDLKSYLLTGISTKYTEKILGKWDFNVNASYVASRKGQPAMKPAEIVAMKNIFRTIFAKTTFLAGSDHTAVIKGYPTGQAGVSSTTETVSGKWEASGDNYRFKATVGGAEQDFPVVLDNGKLMIEVPGFAMYFTREN